MRTLQFQRVLGAGAFGTVYLADLIAARGFRRAVAVKVLLNTGAEGIDFLGRVRDEARLLGLLQDDHILKVLELIRIEGRDSVIMEYVEGVDIGELATALKAAGARPPPRAIAEIGALVAGALHRAHTAVHPATGQAMNVIHRDVKPANIMVTRQGGIKLLDFGVARARFEARETKTGQFVLGTLNYMAPEYIVTGEVSPKADVYGLALTLWEVICGEVFGQPRLRSEQHENRLNERLGRLPAEYAQLVPIFRQMLTWNPTARPDGAEIERMLSHATDHLPGPGLRTWAGEWVARALTLRQQDPKQAQDVLGLQGRTISMQDVAPEDNLEPPPPLPPKPVPPSKPTLPPKPNPPVTPPKKTGKNNLGKNKGLDWKLIVFQAILLGVGLVTLLLLLLIILFFLSRVL